jgi:hypothetical protein
MLFYSVTGMTNADLINNTTWAAWLNQEPRPLWTLQACADISIVQFGVVYSFSIADRVTGTSKHNGEEQYSLGIVCWWFLHHTLMGMAPRLF